MDLVRFLRYQWDRVAGWLAMVLAAIFLVLGWLGVSRYGYPASQLPYIISGGLGAMFLVGLGGVLLLSADLKDEWRKLDAIERKMDASAATGSDEGAIDSDAATNGQGRRTAVARQSEERV